MNVEKYFTKNKTEGTTQIVNAFSELNEKVNKYINKEKMPILDGEIDL